MRVFSIIIYPRVYPSFSRFSLKYIKSNKRAFITRPIFKLDFLENQSLGTIENCIPIIFLNHIPYWLTFDFPIPVWEFINFINRQSFRNKLQRFFCELSRKRCVRVLAEKIRPRSTVFIGRKIERVCEDKFLPRRWRHYLTRDNIRDNTWRYCEGGIDIGNDIEAEEKVFGKGCVFISPFVTAISHVRNDDG